MTYASAHTGCARCCTERPPHELDERGGELVCSDTAACLATAPPLVGIPELKLSLREPDLPPEAA